MSENNWGWAWAAFLAFAVWFGIWGRNSSIRYQMQYGADSEMVAVDREPIDCEFLSAPLGRKDCHYEKEVLVATFKGDTETGRPIISLDNGKTWNWNENGPLTGSKVHVWWRKETP
ncbi:MAG TPA: hypothetical protein VK641_10255 [Terriglobales bacterium]|nr:hypothetical protein [Terriglobales bacterium]